MSKYVISPQRFNLEVDQIISTVNQMFHPAPNADVIANWVAVKYGFKNKQHFVENAKKFNSSDYVWSIKPLQPYEFLAEPVTEVIRKWFLTTETPLVVHNDALQNRDIDPMVMMIGVIVEVMGHIDDAMRQQPSLQHVWNVVPASSYSWGSDWLERILLVQSETKEKREETSNYLLRDAQEVKSLSLKSMTKQETDEFINGLYADETVKNLVVRVRVDDDDDADKLYPMLLSASMTDARWLVEMGTDNLSVATSTNLLTMIDKIVTLG
ncbi:hypothetical protein [Vibrio harveyi]|uniref:hypothetical protein n=1 Tax=Vibrio harveyi TaxID=669 RepID=UPI003CEC0F27